MTIIEACRNLVCITSLIMFVFCIVFCILNLIVRRRKRATPIAKSTPSEDCSPVQVELKIMASIKNSKKNSPTEELEIKLEHISNLISALIDLRKKCLPNLSLNKILEQTTKIEYIFNRVSFLKSVTQQNDKELNESLLDLLNIYEIHIEKMNKVIIDKESNELEKTINDFLNHIDTSDPFSQLYIDQEKNN